jgi:hypothetical protein
MSPNQRLGAEVVGVASDVKIRRTASGAKVVVLPPDAQADAAAAAGVVENPHQSLAAIG